MEKAFEFYFNDTVAESLNEAVVQFRKEDKEYQELLEEKEAFAERLQRDLNDPERFYHWEDMQYQQISLEEKAIYRQAFRDVVYLLKDWLGDSTEKAKRAK